MSTTRFSEIPRSDVHACASEGGLSEGVRTDMRLVRRFWSLGEGMGTQQNHRPQESPKRPVCEVEDDARRP